MNNQRIGGKMDNGYVYILINKAFDGLIKIGKTSRTSNERARELSNTSTPYPFIVAFEVFSNNFSEVAKKLHLELADFRVSNNREFFRFPLKKAIKLLIEENSKHQLNQREDRFEAISIFKEMQERFCGELKQNITSIRIVQEREVRVWLEYTIEEKVGDYLVDQTIRRTDLGFIGEKKGDYTFDPKSSILRNREIWLNEFNDYSIAMCTDILKEVEANKICKRMFDKNAGD